MDWYRLVLWEYVLGYWWKWSVSNGFDVKIFSGLYFYW